MTVMISPSTRKINGRAAYLMTADTEEELKEMSQFVGCSIVRRFNTESHCNLTEYKRNQALLFGAVVKTETL